VCGEATAAETGLAARTRATALATAVLAAAVRAAAGKVITAGFLL
jgi:hypothetical protein